MLEVGAIDRQMIERVRREAYAEADAAADQTVQEPRPTAEDVYRFTYAPSEVDQVFPGDYTGLL